MNKTIIKKVIVRSLIVATILTAIPVFFQIIYYYQSSGIEPAFSILSSTVRNGCYPANNYNVDTPKGKGLLSGAEMICVDGPRNTITLVSIVTSYLVLFVITSVIYYSVLIIRPKVKSSNDKIK